MPMTVVSAATAAGEAAGHQALANPWLEAAPVPEPEPVGPGRARWAPGAEAPVAPGLPLVRTVERHRVWVVGAHGGAGASVLAGLLGAGDAGVAWPVGAPTTVVVAARTHACGVAAAERAAWQWARGEVPGVDLAGLVWVADAPGRLPRVLRERLARVSGAFPTCSTVPWVPAWRTQEEPAAEPAPKQVSRALQWVRQIRQEENNS